MPIPVIDIFAGPGGLGEGFSSILNNEGQRVFKIALSVEKDFFAHQTLTLRSFFRQFEPGNVPDDYYSYLQGKITLENLYERWPLQSGYAKKEAFMAKLGDETDKDSIPDDEIDEKITEALEGENNWLLIGGPPCQAYSIVGRSRRQEIVLDEKKDERVGLYKQYLRILAVHNPAIFVMENVKGILSAKTKKRFVFKKILQDLSNPVRAYHEDFKIDGNILPCPGYKIYSLFVKERRRDKNNYPFFKQKDFIVETEKFGVPQARHRLILLGIRRNIDIIPEILETMEQIPISAVLSGLPGIRSGLSKTKDSKEKWYHIINGITSNEAINHFDSDIKKEILKQIKHLIKPKQDKGSEYIPYDDVGCNYQQDWFLDNNIKGVCNHMSRSHMETDLLRYFFVSCFAKVRNVSPKLQDFPIFLLPHHKNVNEGINNKKFADRFRVQLWNEPSKTITSHISKDGHYYIHPDPSQCRSFTVREAARIQTFPDNYYFCGPRTEQFHQVGNAVPPLLAKRIAIVVKEIFQILDE